MLLHSIIYTDIIGQNPGKRTLLLLIFNPFEKRFSILRRCWYPTWLLSNDRRRLYFMRQVYQWFLIFIVQHWSRLLSLMSLPFDPSLKVKCTFMIFTIDFSRTFLRWPFFMRCIHRDSLSVLIEHTLLFGSQQVIFLDLWLKQSGSILI